MYNFPFAPCIGIIRYGQSIHVAYGFLKNENIEDLFGYLSHFLDGSMDSVQPMNFIINLDIAMKNDILAAFQDGTLCRRHIVCWETSWKKMRIYEKSLMRLLTTT
jgi:hypothetical protein